MRLKFIRIFLSCCLYSAGLHAQSPSRMADEREIIRITQELLDAVVTGDSLVWKKYMADEGFITEEDGVVRSKAEQLQFMRPLTRGFRRNIVLTQPVIRFYEHTAILSIVPKESLEVNGQAIHTSYNETDVFIFRDKQWLMLSSHVAEILSAPATIPLGDSEAYTGTYQLTPEIFYTISLKDGKLMGQRTGRSAQELLPETWDVFYALSQLSHRKIFRRDRSGKVVSLIDRRAGNDLVWKKID